MVMRYRGGGVGHQSTRQATNYFLDDRSAADLERQKEKRDGPDAHDSDLETSSDETDSAGSKEGKSASEDDSEEVHRPGQWEDEEGDNEEMQASEDDNEDTFHEPEEWEEEDEFYEPEEQDEEQGGEDSEEVDVVTDDYLGPEDGLDNDDEVEELGFAPW